MVKSNRGFFYKRLLITVNSFPNAPQVKLPFQATRIMLASRNLKSLEIISFSLLKPDLDGEIFCEDSPIAMDGLSEGRLWFKTTETSNQTGEIRIWAWRGGGN